MVCPTGSGKSIICGHIIQQVVNQRPGYNIWIVSHRKEILTQNAEKLQKLLPDLRIGIYSASLGEKRINKITFASIQSIYKNTYYLDPAHLIIVDEAHLISKNSDSMYQKFIQGMLAKNHDTKIIGMTATPFRMDQGSLLDKGSIFTDVAYNVSIQQLITEGYLSPITSRAPKKEQVDLSGVKTSGYDYVQSEVEERFHTKTTAICKDIVERGAGRLSWLIFCSGIMHAKEIAEELGKYGVAADYLTGEMMPMERDSKIAKFKTGETMALCNCDILTTGFDHPAVDLLVLLRATKSTGLYVQIIGRGMRIAPGKSECLVLDYGGNVSRHGPIDLIDIKPKREKENVLIGVPPTKQCPKCDAIVGTRTVECSCGYIFPADTCLEKKVSELPVISEQEELDVTWHNYKAHNKEGKPPSLKITYGSGPRLVHEFLCFEHGGYATQKAKQIWQKRGGAMPPPVRTDEALRRIEELVRPGKMKIIKDGKWDRVVEIIAKEESREEVEAKEWLEKEGLNI